MPVPELVWEHDDYPADEALCEIDVMCSGSINNSGPPNYSNSCSARWPVTVDLYIGVRIEPQETPTVSVHDNLEDAKVFTSPNVGDWSPTGLPHDFAADPFDFQLDDGDETPNIDAYHIGSKPLGQEGILWAVYKVPKA